MTSSSTPRFYQQHLPTTDTLGLPMYPNLEAVGDPIQDKPETTIRFAFQNVNGLSRPCGLALPSEIEAMDEYKIDVIGMAETNRPWTLQQRSTYDAYMQMRFLSCRTNYSAAPPISYLDTYQPGGTLLSITGHNTGRIAHSGSDTMGRYCWYKLRGRRDEGVLVITAYRVCQEATNNPGPLTAFQQQYSSLLSRGVQKPNPRQQTLSDLSALISSAREEGYRPVLMIDANGDHIRGKDPGLATFLQQTGLSDPFYDKFDINPPTYQFGRSRIDYIFVDPALTSAITHIGYLGTHEGILSDHVMAYIDFDEATLFSGLINRPPPFRSREITVEQADKVQIFLSELLPALEAQNFAQRTFSLARSFTEHKASTENVATYNKLYGQFLRITKDTASKVGRRDFGYARSPTLVTRGQEYLAARYLYECKLRGAPPTKRLRHLGTILSIDVDELILHPAHDLRLRLRYSRKALWECQKNGETLRSEWLARKASAIASALGEADHKARLHKMKKRIQTSAMNRKLSTITKGRRGALNMIQVPAHDWFLCTDTHELLHYDNGVFEAYSPVQGEPHRFHSHHTLKVLPPQIEAVRVQKDPTGKFWHIVETLPLPTPLWIDITKCEAIEDNLLRRNERHLQQTAKEEGISTTPLFTALRENNGFNPLSAKVLDGTPITEFEITPETAEFLQTLKRPPSSGTLPPVLGTITSTDFQKMFNCARERTSSDSRTLNYSLWKCLAQSDKISGFVAILLSLPFTYGFVNEHWTHMTDFMLEKKPGVRHIHLLRIIGKVAAEFNTCLKLFIGKQARDNFEASDPCDEQHGFRPHRSPVDAMMLKLLSFEAARMQKITMGSLQHDMTAHFDRMYPEMTAILASKYSVDERLLTSVGMTIAKLKRNVETALGVSTAHYGQETSQHRIGGMVQGKADVPQLATQQSDAMLTAHKALTYGLTIVSPNTHRSISHHSVAFADDTEGQVTCDTNEHTSVSRLVRQLQHSGQTWSNLTSMYGGLIALHKCHWQLLQWVVEKNHLTLKHDTTETVVLTDGKGAHSTITYLPPTQPNVGLGFHLCPSGNQLPHYMSTLEALQKLCRSSMTAHLSEAETLQLLTQRILPKLKYRLHGTSFSPLQCQKLTSILRTTLLPRLRLNRHFPGAVLHAPFDFGGLEFPDISIVQDQVQLDYVIKQLRWDRTVANDFLVTLDSVQLCSGFVTPLLQNTTRRLDYLDHSYIIHLRRRLALVDGSLWIEKAWIPSIQRDGDESIMERFSSLRGITRAKLRQANAVRLYLRVITIADLADLSGKTIQEGILTGSWRANSDLRWPYQPLPPDTFWATFRSCLRRAFATATPPTQPILNSMTLDTQLGNWLSVPRSTWRQTNRDRDTLYWREEDVIHAFKQTNLSGFYFESHTVQHLPLDSHPILGQRVGSQLWSHRSYHPTLTIDKPDLPPGHILDNTISSNDIPNLLVGSDGSLHRDHGISTCAWMIQASDTQRVRACLLITGITSLSSYRSELEGIYRCLHHIHHLGLTPSFINQWSDNKAAVDKSNITYWKPSDMLRPDADILLAINHIKHLLTPSIVDCRHLYGHQDTRSRPMIESDDPSNTFSGEEGIRTNHRTKHTDKPPHVLLNIECDRIATETSRIIQEDPIIPDLPPTLTPPYPGSKALLQLGDKWITSHQQRHLLLAHHRHKFLTYCMEKYDWEYETFQLIDWDAVRSVRRRLTQTQRMQTAKLMHDWAPVMHMLAHETGNSQCPGCPHPDETLDHLFRCTNPRQVEQRRTLLLSLRKAGLAKGWPRAILEALLQLLQDFVDGEQPSLPSHPQIRVAVESQIRIGIHLIPRGFLSTEWTSALESFQVCRPRTKITSLLRFLLLDYTDALWRSRNDILHHQENATQQATARNYNTRLQWYLENQHVIAQSDCFIIRYKAEDLNTMSDRVKRHTLHHLDLARKAQSIRLQQRQQGQSVITQFFQRVVDLH